MEDCNEKKTAGLFEISNESSGVSFRDPKHDKKNFDYFSRIGCNSRHGSSKCIQSSSPGKMKYLKPPLRSKSSNHSSASSSRSLCLSTNLNLSCHGSWKNLADNAECNIEQIKEEDGLKFDFEFRGKNKEIDFSQGIKTPFLHSSPTSLNKTLSNSKSIFTSRLGKQISEISGCAIQDTVSPPFRQSLAPRVSIQTPKSIPQCPTGRPQRYGLKTLGCASISDALLSESSSDGHYKRAIQLRQKFHDGEGSSSGMSLLQDKQKPESTSRGTNTLYTSRDGTVSGKMCSTFGGESSRMRSNEQENEHLFRLPQPSLFPTLPHTSLTISEIVQERSPNTSFAGTSWSNSRSSRRRSVSRSESRDDYPRMNMEGIAEVLHALERIEQDEELTYEQLMVLEANLLEGFSFHDQHRDMRLDIDNMSYEDLLALEEKIGCVSTAVPEDSLWKCLKKSTYKAIHMRQISGHGDDEDIKCSICQEEYVIGEEVGRLPCKHLYHTACIRRWLRMKNWCPICKAPPFLS